MRWHRSQAVLATPWVSKGYGALFHLPSRLWRPVPFRDLPDRFDWLRKGGFLAHHTHGGYDDEAKIRATR